MDTIFIAAILYIIINIAVDIVFTYWSYALNTREATITEIERDWERMKNENQRI